MSKLPEQREKRATSQQIPPNRPLNELVRRSYILTYTEDVTPLFSALAEEKLNPETLRASYSETELTFPRAIRTFLSHRAAWQRATEQEGYTLICESDYVPCRGVGAFPSFWPLSDPMGWGYLYAGSPRLLALVGERRYLRAHCSPLVSYVVNPAIARILCNFFQSEIYRLGTKAYFPFDAHLQWSVMGAGGNAFIPMRNYGEHGGFPNPEHAVFGLPRAGQHRADNLATRLHFLPQYSRGSIFRYLGVRAYARLLGIGRLLANKWVLSTNAYHNGLLDQVEMHTVGVKRLLPSTRQDVATG
ncbi:hypothetical protein [Reyranella soli]|uniref:Glycosyl transferase n=1 Tax=Reyranella soli TaxID=1230389 RepID=A0A512NC79_9HYPH|nr:hypothetical protein [Reyranella soli]GEP56558.1 hypothetical protein RSO01_37240 [Reyranella soli]